VRQILYAYGADFCPLMCRFCLKLLQVYINVGYISVVISVDICFVEILLSVSDTEYYNYVTLPI